VKGQHDIDKSLTNINQHLWQGTSEPSTVLHLRPGAAEHVESYIQYDRVVGDADRGYPLPPDQLHRFVQSARSQRGVDRLYAFLRSPNGIDCKALGPQSLCLCGHRFRQHTTDNLRNEQRHRKDVHCRHCACNHFCYLPTQGSWSARCSCKHDANEHHPRSQRCLRCEKCIGFASSFSCSCGELMRRHETVIETREEREQAGRPVAHESADNIPYEAMGGVMTFTSLLSGVERFELEQQQREEQNQREQYTFSKPTTRKSSSSLGRLKDQRRSSGRRMSFRSASSIAGTSGTHPRPSEQLEVAPIEEARAPAHEKGLPGSTDELEQLHRIKGTGRAGSMRR